MTVPDALAPPVPPPVPAPPPPPVPAPVLAGAADELDELLHAEAATAVTASSTPTA
ncbi:MAG: hypothetical protein ACRDOI_42465 [Trebonia sp.]